MNIVLNRVGVTGSWLTRASVPPPATTAACFIAMGIFLTGGGASLALLPSMIGLLVVYIVPLRLMRATRAIWLTRLGLFSIVLALNAGHATTLSDTWMTAAGLDLVVPLLAAEIVIRAWSSPSDSRQMLLLSGLIVLGGCSSDNDRVGIYWLPVYFAFAIFALRADRRRAPDAASAPSRLRVGALMLLALLLGGGATWAMHTYENQLLAWGASNLSAPHRSDADVSGIAKDPTLGPTFGSPGASTRIYLIAGSLPDPHLRGMAYDTYQSGRWQPLTVARHLEPVPRADLVPHAPGSPVHFTRLVDDDGMVSAPLSSAGIDLGTAAAAATWDKEHGGPLDAETIDPLRYTAKLGPTLAYQGPLCTPPDTTELGRCLQVPGQVDPQVRQLAHHIVGRLRDPSQKIDAVENYLLRSNAYSLTTRPGPGDPVSDFLLHHKAAHCEFFASAAAILLRCVGVPTRYVIGYYAHEGDGHGRTVVRGQDAHAWDESWVRGVGWVLVDATPGDGRPDQTTRTSFWWKWRDRWQDFVLLVREGLTAGQRWALVGALLAGLLASSAYRAWRQRGQAKTGGFAYAAPPDGLAPLEARFERLLTARGLPCPAELPWDEHLAHLHAEEDPSFAAFIAAYNRARFGGAPDPDAVSDAARALGRLENTT